MTDSPPKMTRVKTIIRTADSYLVLEFHEDACTEEWKQDAVYRLRIKDDPELQEIETISLMVMDLDRNTITKGDVDDVIIPTSSIVWMSTSEGCNYPPFRNQVNG